MRCNQYSDVTLEKLEKRDNGRDLHNLLLEKNGDRIKRLTISQLRFPLSVVDVNVFAQLPNPRELTVSRVFVNTEIQEEDIIAVKIGTVNKLRLEMINAAVDNVNEFCTIIIRFFPSVIDVMPQDSTDF